MTTLSKPGQVAGLSPQEAASMTGHRDSGQAHPRQDPGFTFIDLFAGIGGLRRGFEPFRG